MTQGIPGGAKIETEKTNTAQGTNSAHDRSINNNNPFLPDVPLHPDPLYKPSSLHQNTNKISHNPNINLDLWNIHHFKKASYLRLFKGQTNHFSESKKA